MGTFILIALLVAIFVLSFLVPIIAKIFIHFDYVFLLAVVWAFVLGAGGRNESGLLYGHEIHTVFVILIYLAAFGIWFGVQQIRIFNIYIFRIIACALSAYIVVYMASDGWFGQTIADGMDPIWTWTAGIVYFVIAVTLRTRDNSLVRREETD